MSSSPRRTTHVGSILHDLGAAPDQIKQILAVLGAASERPPQGRTAAAYPAAAPPSLGRVMPLRVIISKTTRRSQPRRRCPTPATMCRSTSTTSIPRSPTQSHDKNADVTDGGVTLYQSLYETALRNNIPQAVVDEMVGIYAYDVDFQRKVQPGDSFDVLYAEDTNGDGTHEVRFAALTVGGETKNYYHFTRPTTASTTITTRPARARRNSWCASRSQPASDLRRSAGACIPSHTSKIHSGVDWAAPLGTPIFAAGNGTIDEIGLKGGYGKYVRILHADGYETAYGHMTAFARGLEVGSRVRQGQVIGFVGSTGMSTGAHVHFEIHINGRFVNPMTVKLPRGRVLDGPTLAEFERNREQLNSRWRREPARRADALRHFEAGFAPGSSPRQAFPAHALSRTSLVASIVDDAPSKSARAGCGRLLHFNFTRLMFPARSSPITSASRPTSCASGTRRGGAPTNICRCRTSPRSRTRAASSGTPSAWKARAG